MTIARGLLLSLCLLLPQASFATTTAALRTTLESAAEARPEPGAAEIAAGEAAFAEMQRRGALNKFDWWARRNLLLRSWRFDIAARAMEMPDAAAAFGDRVLPISIVGAGPDDGRLGFWSADLDARRLTEVREPVGSDVRLLIVGHPFCHFCKLMAKDFAADHELMTITRSCGRWIGKVDLSYDMKSFDDWRRDYPKELELVLFRHWQKLGIAEPRSTPTVLLMRGAKVVDSMRGWPPGGNKAALLAMLHRNGAAARCRSGA